MCPLGSPKQLEQRRRLAGKQSKRSAARPPPGRPPQLNPTRKKALEEYLRKGAQASGCDTDLWTLPRVAQPIVRRFGVY